MSVRDVVQAAAGALGGAANPYIEDVFSTYVYDGSGSAQTITNGIDLETEGGLVWIKQRSGAGNHLLQDTERGITNVLYSNDTAAQTDYNYVTVNTDGFDLVSGGAQNSLYDTFTSWTFRKAPKFFDVVTYTGNGTAGRTVAHNLGSVPGWIIVKRLDVGASWAVYHRSLGGTKYVTLNTTDAALTSNGAWNDTDPTDSVFTVGDGGFVNTPGGTYVAYLFAHDAGGFGDSGEENVISCGALTTDSSGNATVNLGYEPQWVLYKRADSSTGGSWRILDNMRGFYGEGVSTSNTVLFPNASDAESTSGYGGNITSTGFKNLSAYGNATYIYIAIRRGPMKTPTDATTVFTPAFASSSGAYTATAGFPVDAVFYKNKAATEQQINRFRLGGPYYLVPNTTAAQVANANGTFDSNTSFDSPVSGDYSNYINWMFRRAPGFFDVVCYTGNGTSGRTVDHNLGVTPEFIIFKRRDTSGYGWPIYHSALGTNSSVYINGNDPAGTEDWVNSTAPTSSVVTLSGENSVNASGGTYVAYLFASCPGVSKVGTYTGNGTGQTIDCGFANGARFVLIRNTSAGSNWYVFDTLRGIVSGNDPALLLNATIAQITDTDYIDPASSGFQLNSDLTMNASGNTYIYLAIA